LFFKQKLKADVNLGFLVKDLVVNLLTKWKAFHEDIVSPCDSLTTQLRHIGNLLGSIYDRKAASSSINCSPREPPQVAFIIRTKRVASTCTSEDNVLDPPPPPKQLTSSFTQTESLILNSVETQTSCHSQTIETQTEAWLGVENSDASNSVGNGNNLSLPSGSNILLTTSESQTDDNLLKTARVPYDASVALVPAGHSEFHPDPPEPAGHLTKEAKVKLQLAFRNHLLEDAQDQELLATLINQQYFPGVQGR